MNELQKVTCQRVDSVQVDMDTPDIQPKFAYDSIEWGYYDRVFRRCAGIQGKWHHYLSGLMYFMLDSHGWMPR